jgi:DNA polymerase V
MEKKAKETGFPSPAQGYEAQSIDFNRTLIQNPAATYVMEAAASDMADKGIFPGSLLIVDRSVKPKSGSLVILAHDGEFLCRQMFIKGRQVVFTDGTTDLFSGETEIVVFGTITAVITRP